MSLRLARDLFPKRDALKHTNILCGMLPHAWLKIEIIVCLFQVLSHLHDQATHQARYTSYLT